MHFLILSGILQISLIVHAIRTNRSPYWIWILFLVPGIGSAAYIVVELLPELLASRGARGAIHGVKKTLSSGSDLRRRQREHQLSRSVDTARNLAAELTASGRYSDAIELYNKTLTGLYENDPDLLLGLAKAQFESSAYDEAKRTLDRLIEENPDFKSPAGHLLYARAADLSGDLALAEHEYGAVAAYYAGAQAKVRYATFLERIGKNDEALDIYQDVADIARLAPRHYRKAQKKWLEIAKDAVTRLRT